MTLSTTASRISYAGAGTTGPFAFPFKIFANTDLRVTKRSTTGVETRLAYGTDYSVAGVNNATGTVTLTSALGIGDTLVIRRVPPITQPVSIRNQGAYFASTHEDHFDRIAMQMQALRDDLDRSVKLKETIPGAGALTELEPTAGMSVIGTGTGFTMGSPNTGPITLAAGGQLTPKAGTVDVEPYLTVASGAANFGPTTGQTALEFVGIGHMHRIRQNGTLIRTRFYLAATTGITGLYLKVWRLNGSTYDLVGQSANLSAGLAGGAINTVALSPGIVVQEGDYVGMRVEYSAASVQNFFASTIPLTTLGENGGTIYSVLNTTPSATGYNWAAQTATADRIVLQGVDMAPPVLVMIGDSITSGLPVHASFADPYTQATSIPDNYPYRLGHTLGYTYQNMGRGGEGVAQMAARFAVDVVAKQPRFVFILAGVNDILATATNATILVSYTAMLNAAIAAGITPVVIGVTPFRGYASATTAMLQQRDLLNASLQALVTSSPYNGYYVNADPYLGTYFATGDAANLWTLLPKYSSGDGIHPNSAGYVVLAQAIVDKLLTTVSSSVAQVQQLTTNITQSGSNTGVANVAPTAKLAVGDANTNPNGNIYQFGYGFAKTDTTTRRAGTLAQSNESANPFILYVQAIGAAVLANRSAGLQTADEGVANGGNLILQPSGGNVQIGGTMVAVPLNRLTVFGTFSVGDGTFNTAAPALGAIIQGVVGIGISAPLNTKLHVVKGSSTTTQDTASIKAYNTNTKGIWMGYDTTNNIGLIGSVTEGASHDPLLLCPLGGALGLGFTGGSPNASALFEMRSTTKGFIAPVMTTAQRDAIGSPAEGLIIYNVTTHKLNVRTAAAWEAVTSV